MANVHVSARETSRGIVFMHDVREGPANRSYGIAVAELAGMPAAVTRRARAMMAEIEARSVVSDSQLDLFAIDAPSPLPAEESESAKAARHFAEEVSMLDVDDLSPRDALALLYTLKEKAELILNGGEKAISAILPVLDDMERAIDNGRKTEDSAAIREGMELIFSKFQKILESLGVKKIETEGADFDTDIHEAVAMVPTQDDDKKGKVIDCIQTGYKLNDKVIRHAKVAVGQ